MVVESLKAGLKDELRHQVSALKHGIAVDG